MKIQTIPIPKEPEFSYEHNDCIVRALTRRIKTSYSRAHLMSLPFRKPKHKCYKTRALLECAGLEIKVFNRSLKEFIKENPEGCYLVGKRGHAFCVDQGRIFDDGRSIGNNTRIIYYA
jgi:hypothetical protein